MDWGETKKLLGGLNTVYCRCPDASKGGGSGSDNGKQLVYSGRSSQELADGLDMWGARERNQSYLLCSPECTVLEHMRSWIENNCGKIRVLFYPR